MFKFIVSRSRVAKVSVSRTVDLGSIPAYIVDFFKGRVIPVTEKNGTPVPTLPGAWGLVGPVSIYCDRVRQKV